nr:MAG TPA_asm: hydrogenase/urease nickel incorporation protein [Caudoviricetes sp.]
MIPDRVATLTVNSRGITFRCGNCGYAHAARPNHSTLKMNAFLIV